MAEADDESVTLDVDGVPTRLDLADVSSGRVQVEFARAKGTDHADDNADVDAADTEEG